MIALRPVRLLLFAVSVAAADWPAAVTASPAGEYRHAGRAYASSTSLEVAWAPAPGVDHYAVTAAELRSAATVDLPAGTRAFTFTGLKAATTYRFTVRACLTPNCGDFLESGPPVAATTEAEYWRIQGAGSSYATAARLVPDGNVGSYAFRYGPWAGPALDGKIQLYYTPLQREEKGIKIGEMLSPVADSLEAASAFRPVSGFGLLRVCLPVPGTTGPPALPAECTASNSLASGINLFQAVPVARRGRTPRDAATVRLFFEAQGIGGRTRILSLDSHDGYAGRDFHPGTPTRCDTLQDYSPGGPCAPVLAIGVDLDGPLGNPNLRNARQFKIAYPTLESWLWDEAPGTFMWFTTEWSDGACSPYGFNAAYAVWTGRRWRVDYQPDGCPKLLAGIQAPAPVHLGGAAYKLYFNRHPRPGGPTDPQLALKPMQMLYADPGFSGDPARVEFEDWEPLASAREVHYLWPAGGLLSPEDESRLDDYVVFAPTGDASRLIMYSNMSVAGGVPFIGSAVLVNP